MSKINPVNAFMLVYTIFALLLTLTTSAQWFAGAFICAIGMLGVRLYDE